MGTRDDLINTLLREEGYREGQDSDGNWNNHQKYSPAVPGLEWSQDQAWCATFESWAAEQVGFQDSWPITASCSNAVQWWKDQSRWTDYPVLGGPFYMGSQGQDHTGVVYAYDADSIYTIEGNTNDDGSYQGNGVYRRVRPRRGANSPYGYGVPNYPEGTVSADPALGGVLDSSTMQAAPKPSPVYAPFPGAGFFYIGQHNDLITKMGRRLVAVGCSRYLVGPSPDFTKSDIQSYAAWQRKLGYQGSDADGIPGPDSWAKLQVPSP